MILDKKGEITSFHLVALIIAIVGFVVVLILLFSLEFESFSEEEVCRLSVLSRATSPLSVQGYVPLQCTTKKVCITDVFGGKCSQFAGEDYKTVRLEGSDSEKADKISSLLAENLYDCWSMMGEGKLDLFSGRKDAKSIVSSSFFEEQKDTACLICSRVALADDLSDFNNKDYKKNEKEVKNILRQVDLGEYMRENGPKGSSRSYLYLITGGQIDAFPVDFNKELENVPGEDGLTDQISFVFMQILVSKESLKSAIESGRNTGILLGGALFLSPIGKATSVFGASNLLKAGITILGGGASAGVSYLNAEKNQEIAALHCGDFTSNDPDRAGCSIVRPVDYNNIDEINKLCWKIEGNP